MLSIPPPLRSLFFFLVVLTFLATTASVLLHTFGYRFSFDRGIFIYTGSITLKANPTDIEVAVNGRKVKEKGLGVLNSSIHIPGLSPGEYLVEATADGYHSWTKKAVVESGRSTEFWNVQLTKLDPEWRNLSGTEHTLRVIASPEDNIFALIKKNGNEYTVDILNSDTSQSEQVFSTSDPILVGTESRLIWSADGRRLVVPVASSIPRQATYYFVDTRTKEAFLIHQLSPETLSAPVSTEHIRFDPTAENVLLFKNGANLYRLDLGTPDSAPKLLSSSVAAFNISGRTLYYLSSDNGIVYAAPLERNSLSPYQLTLKPLPMEDDLTYEIHAYDRNRLGLLEKSSGKLFVFNSEASDRLRELQTDGVRGMQFSDDGKKLLFFTANEISVYFTRDWEVQPSRAAYSLVQIGRFSQELGHVQWTKDYEHVLFTLDTHLKLIELDNRDRRNILDVATLPAAPLQVHSDFRGNKLYIVAPEKENTPPLVRVLNFPEPTGFFSFGFTP